MNKITSTPGPTNDQTKLLFSVLSAIDHAFIVWDDDYRLLLCNDGMRDLWRYPESLLTPGMLLIDLLRFQARIGAYGQGDPEQLAKERFEKLSREKDGEEELLTLGDGKILRSRAFNIAGLGRVFSYTDLTEEMRAQQEVLDNEVRFQKILESSPIGIAVISYEPTERIFVNEAFRILLGAETMKGLLTRDISPTWRDPAALEYVRSQLAAKKHLVDFVAERVRADGTIRWVLMNTHDAVFSGKNCRVVWHHDITDRVIAETALQESQNKLEVLNANKDRFFSILSHDLRGPFVGLLGYTKILADIARREGGDDVGLAAESVNESAQGVYDLLENLLDWSRLQMNRVEFNPRQINISKIVEETCQLFEPVAAEKSVQLTVQIGRSVKVFADPDMVSTILRNLIGNAIKFTPEKGIVSVAITQNPEGAEIRVSDNGLGLSSDQLERLFDIGEKTQRTGTRGETGTGLGLHICKELVEKQSGGICVESEEGKGSVFTVTLPSNKA